MDPQSAYKRLAETSLVAEDLISAFDPQEDVAKIYRIARIKDECKHTLETKERESREIIKGDLSLSLQWLHASVILQFVVSIMPCCCSNRRTSALRADAERSDCQST